jgi:HK97 family phage portal protein
MSTALTKSMTQGRAMVNTFRESAGRLKDAGGLGSMLSPSVSGGDFFGGFREQAKSKQSYGAFRNWLYAAINAVAMEAAAQPISVAKVTGAMRDGEKRRPKGSKAFSMGKMPRSIRNKAASQEYEVLLDHPLLDVLEHPNEMQYRWQFIYTFVANLNLTGWAYIVFDQDDDGKLRMYSLPTTWVRPDHADGPFSKFYIVNPNDPGSQKMDKPLTKDNVAFAYLPDPANPLGAIAPATSQMPAIKIDDYIQFSQQQHFQNGIFPSVIVTVGKNPHPDVPGGIRPRLNGPQRRQVTAAISKAMGGVANYGSPAIVDGLIESITRLSMSGEEMGWGNSEDKVRTRILSAFGVHPYILGEPVSVGGYAQVANIEKRFYKRVNSFLDMLSGMLTQIVSGVSDEDLMVWVEQCQVVDPQLRQSAMAAGRSNGDVSQNEWRAEIGLPPDEDRNEALLGASGASIVGALLPIQAQGGMTPDQMRAVLTAMGLPDDVASDIAGPDPEPQPAQPGAVPVPAVLSKPEEPKTDQEVLTQATNELAKAVELLKVPPDLLSDLVLPLVQFDPVGVP